VAFTYICNNGRSKAFDAVVTTTPNGYCLTLSDLGVIEPTPSSRLRRRAHQKVVPTEYTLPGAVGDSDSSSLGESSAFHEGSKQAQLYLHSQQFAPISVGHKLSMTIGRDPSNDLVLNDNMISRFHVTLKIRGRRIAFEDLGSSNGLFINGSRQSQGTLTVGDKMVLGPFQFFVRDTSKAGPFRKTEPLKIAKAKSLMPDSSLKVPDLSGQLSSWPLSTLGNLIEAEKKSGLLTISASQCNGKLAFNNGYLVSAETETHKSAKAVQQLLMLKEGLFTLVESQETLCFTGRKFSSLVEEILKSV
jgi:pSer/pThr/pTyr-binding forkhead associated (FHA) protein